MILLDLIYNLAVLVALSVISGFIDLRFSRISSIGKISQGLLFGFTAIIGMMYPFNLTPGIIFDGRSIVISLCTLFFGSISGSIASIITIIFRLYLGGGGAETGAIVILSSYIIGLIFFYKKNAHPEIPFSNLQFYIFGLIVNGVSLIIFWNLPVSNKIEMFKTITPTILGVYPFATLLIGKILLDQEEKHTYIKKIKERAEEFSEIYNSTNEAIFIDDALTGKIIDCNRRTVEMYGYNSKEEIIKGNIGDLSASIEPFNEEAAQKLIRKAINEGPHSFEWLAKKKNGEIFWVEVSLKKTEIGGKGRILAVVRDINERKKAEEELRTAKERMQLLVEGTPHLFYYIQDENLKITYVSPSIYSITGRTEDEWLSQKHWFVTDSEINEEARIRTRENLNGKVDPKPIDLEIMHKDGKPILLEIYERPIFKDNKVVGLQGVAHDITEKEAIEKKLRLLSRSVDQSPVSVVITDVQGKIEYVNPRFTELTGFSYEEAVGRNPRILKSDYYGTEFYKNLWDTILSGKDFRCEFLNKKKNGELFWENAIISPIFNNENKITHFVSVKEDITEKKKIIEDLIIAKEKAEEMNKVKSFFFASMSHELRTPFVGIQGFAELLSEKVKTSDEKELVDGIILSSNRLTDTLNKILSLSKMEIEEIEINQSEIDINELLNDIHQTFTPSLRKKKLEFKLIKTDPDVKIKSDEKILTGILNNLLSNAIKFTDEGWIELKASVVSRENQDYLQLTVCDTGVGIPDEKRDQIWLAFRQVSEGYNRHSEGTGLGLTITKRYVDRLRGEILLKSQAGKGSSFFVEIPVTIVKKEMIRPDSQTQQTKTISEKTNSISKRLLYVEDDIYSQKIVTRTLSPNYEIDIAEDSDAAQKKLKEILYDCILIDINLGRGLDGVQLMQLIRKIPEYRYKPIVAITAFAANSDRDEFLMKGFSHYISKPFPLRNLSSLVENIFKE